MSRKRSDHLRAVLIAVLLQIFHEGRAAGAYLGVVAGVRRCLLVDVARGIFEVAGAKGADREDVGVERFP